LIVRGLLLVGCLVMLPAASAATTPKKVKKPIAVAVTAGKPTEFSFKLSKASMIPVGPVVFNVTNKGKVAHNFKVCTAVGAKTANACAGKVTKTIKPGQSAKLS